MKMTVAGHPTSLDAKDDLEKQAIGRVHQRLVAA
tara:strand:- start:8349 stop:8450 length:102 start_codon:yes stop_codon:yes gene_type:complete